MDGESDMRAVAALLCGCEESEVIALHLYDDRLAVVYGFGQKKVFGMAEVVASTEALRGPQPVEQVDAVVAEERVQMIAPVTVTVSSDVAGLDTLFPARLVKVLVAAGLETPRAVMVATDELLGKINGIGPSTLRDIRELLPYPQQVPGRIEG